MTHRAVGLIPSADLPSRQKVFPASQTLFAKRIQRLSPQPDVMDDFGDHFILETPARISASRPRAGIL